MGGLVTVNKSVNIMPASIKRPFARATKNTNANVSRKFRITFAMRIDSLKMNVKKIPLKRSKK